MPDIDYLEIQVLDSANQSSRMLSAVYQELWTSTARESGSSPTNTHEHSAEESSDQQNSNKKLLMKILFW